KEELSLRGKVLHVFRQLRAKSDCRPVQKGLSPEACKNRRCTGIIGVAEAAVVEKADISAIFIVSRLKVDGIKIGLVVESLTCARKPLDFNLDIVATRVEREVRNIILSGIEREFPLVDAVAHDTHDRLFLEHEPPPPRQYIVAKGIEPLA